MKKIFIGLILFLGLPLLAESYPYVSANASLFPGVGLGYRSYPSKHGYDLSASIDGLNDCCWGCKVRGLYLYRPYQKGWYCGIGGGAEYSYYEGRRLTYPTANGVVGYEWKKTFLELEATSPNLGPYLVPTLTFGVHF